jgi:hypothetical protein
MSEMYYLMGLNYLRGLSYAVASAFGLRDALMALLSRRLDESAAAEAYAIIDHIRRTPLPGFSDDKRLQQHAVPSSLLKLARGSMETNVLQPQVE